MHQDELWQAYGSDGERISGGYDASRGNPKIGTTDRYVGVANVWLYRFNEASEVEVLFQQRSPKVANGGSWDVSAGGHINNGEKVADAAVRELYEEIGAKVQPEDLEHIFEYKTLTNVQMFISYFVYNWSGRPDNFKYDDGEVSQVKWVRLADFDKFIDENAKPPLKDVRYARELTKFWLENKQSNGNH